MLMDNAPVLFEDYTYGMAKSQIAERMDARPCPQSLGNPLSLCGHAPVAHLNEEWQIIFNFNNLGELQEILLIQERKNAGQYDKVKEGLNRSDWLPVFLETDGKACDSLEVQKKEGKEKTRELIKAFAESALENDRDLTITFFPDAYLHKALKSAKIKTYMQALDMAPENFRVITLMVTGDFIKLSFTAPLLSRKNALRYGQVIRRN